MSWYFFRFMGFCVECEKEELEFMFAWSMRNGRSQSYALFNFSRFSVYKGDSAEFQIRRMANETLGIIGAGTGDLLSTLLDHGNPSISRSSRPESQNSWSGKKFLKISRVPL